jgi:endogenous inhibitor of DNA gyrase (YacG/DUF329 family)
MKLICPICKAETTWEENPDRPFCSERCRLMDLGKWVSGEYKVEGGKLEKKEPDSGGADDE